MRRLRALWKRMGVVFARRPDAEDFSAELESHLQMHIEENVCAGMPEREARRRALIRLGGLEQTRQAWREQNTIQFLEDIAADARYARRSLRRNPAFAITAVAVLALGIGINTAMFSVLYAALIRPLPYHSPDQLAMLWTTWPKKGQIEERSAYWNVQQWAAQSRAFAEIAMYDPTSEILTMADSAQKISAVNISSNFFSLLGVQPFRGRMFTSREAQERNQLAVVTYDFWQAHLAGSQNAIGAKIVLNGISYEVVGILPASFRFLGMNADVWEPYTTSPDWTQTARGGGSWFAVGRLRPDVTVEQAQAEMNTLAWRLDKELPSADENLGIGVTPLSLQVAGPKARLALWMLTGAVFCVLLIAITNVASLLLARGASREKEIAIRAALGASQARIFRQLLTESAVLAFMSGLAGLLIALTAIRLVMSFKLKGLDFVQSPTLNLQAMGCALGLCIFTGILVGLVPAITMVRRNLRFALQDGGRGSPQGAAPQGLRRALIVIEFALAIILVTGAGLLTRSLWAVENVHLGFTPDGVLSLQLSSPAIMATTSRTDFYNRILERIQSLPGIEGAGVIENLFTSTAPEQLVNTDADGGGAFEQVQFREDAVSPGFFNAIGCPLVRGRSFTAEDGLNPPAVAIVNDAMAKRLWPGRNPVGRRFRIGAANSSEPWLTVIGVVGDMRRRGLESEPTAQLFEPLGQDPPRLATLLVKTSSKDPLNAAQTIEAAVHQVEKFAPVYGVTTLENQLSALLIERSFQTWVITGFSAVALLLAAVGIFGLIHYSVSRRTQEIGIRIALGAQKQDIFRMVLGQGITLALIGIVIGAAAALALTRLMPSLLYGISATDPLTFITAVVILTLAAVVASFQPALRATRIDPLRALRTE